MQKEKTANRLQNDLVVCIVAICCCFLWGSAFPSIKTGYNLFHITADAWQTQLLFAGIRFTTAAILVIIIGSVTPERKIANKARHILVPQKSSWGMIFLLAMMQTVIQYIFFYIGLAHASGVKSSIIEASNVFLAILVASLLFQQEKLGIKKIVGTMIGFAGVVFVNISGTTGIDLGFSIQGEGFIFFSAVAYAFASVLIKKFSSRENPVILSGYQFLVGGMILMVVGFACGGRITQVNWQGVLLLLYMAFISAASYSLWGLLLKYNPVSKVTIYGFFNPVFGVILSGLFLGEGDQAFGYKSIIALIFVSIGIFVVNTASANKNRNILEMNEEIL